MRNEEKFICDDKTLVLIEHTLRALLPADAHQKGKDYRVRSLYFDTEDDRLYHESASGVDARKKYRIRFYDMNTSFFRFERKDTKGRLKAKTTSPMSADMVEDLLERGRLREGIFEGMSEKDASVLREAYMLQQTEGLHPVAVVDYRRTAFTYPVGNVRITIDRDISCTDMIREFLDGRALLYPVLPAGRHILEVKYDAILPGFIGRALETGSLEQVSFSKYVYSRENVNVSSL